MGQPIDSSTIGSVPPDGSAAGTGGSTWWGQAGDAARDYLTDPATYVSWVDPPLGYAMKVAENPTIQNAVTTFLSEAASGALWRRLVR